MGGKDNIQVARENGNATPLYRVRDSQIFNLGSLVALVAVFGGFWNYYSNERDAQMKLVEQIEARYTREIDRLEKRIDELDSRWERRMVWVEREIKK